MSNDGLNQHKESKTWKKAINKNEDNLKTLITESLNGTLEGNQNQVDSCNSKTESFSTQIAYQELLSNQNSDSKPIHNLSEEKNGENIDDYEYTNNVIINNKNEDDLKQGFDKQENSYSRVNFVCDKKSLNLEDSEINFVKKLKLEEATNAFRNDEAVCTKVKNVKEVILANNFVGFINNHIDTDNRDQLDHQYIDSLAVYKLPKNPILNGFHTNLRGNLRKNTESSVAQNENKKNKKIKFNNVTVFYFSRSQGFSCVPSQGGSTLGMTRRHFYIRDFSVAEHTHEQKKSHRDVLMQIKQKRHRVKKKSLASLISDDSDSNSCEESSDLSDSEIEADPYFFLQPLPTRRRRSLLRQSGIKQIEAAEKEECKSIRRSRELCGCQCKVYCDPSTCQCSILGVKCQVDRHNFPCSCSREGCRNETGRIEFNPIRVRSHFLQTIMRLELEKYNSCENAPWSPTNATSFYCQNLAATSLLGNQNLAFSTMLGSTNLAATSLIENSDSATSSVLQSQKLADTCSFENRNLAISSNVVEDQLVADSSGGKSWISSDSGIISDQPNSQNTNCERICPKSNQRVDRKVEDSYSSQDLCRINSDTLISSKSTLISTFSPKHVIDQSSESDFHSKVSNSIVVFNSENIPNIDNPKPERLNSFKMESENTFNFDTSKQQCLNSLMPELEIIPNLDAVKPECFNSFTAKARNIPNFEASKPECLYSNFISETLSTSNFEVSKPDYIPNSDAFKSGYLSSFTHDSENKTKS